MPYLVDSVTAEVVRQGVTLAHIVHPVVVVRRDLRGKIKAFCDSSLAVGCGSDALTESWMAVVVDGTLDDEAAADLVTGLRTVLDDVRAVDEDAERLRARVLELAARLDELPAPSPAPDADPADDPAEAAALLRWLADGNFVFLGAREVDLVAEPREGRGPRRPRHRARRPAQRHRHDRVGGRHARGDPLPRAAPGGRHQGRRPLPRAPPGLARPRSR